MPAKILVVIALFYSGVCFATKITFNEFAAQKGDHDIYLQKSQRYWQLDLTINALELEVKRLAPFRGPFSHITIEGLKNAQLVGAPALPYYSFLIESSKDDLEVDLSFEKRRTLEGLRSLPALEKPCRCDEDKLLGPKFLPEHYQQGEDQLVELVEIGDYRGRAITQIIVRPLLQKGQDIVAYEDIHLELRSKSDHILREPTISAQNKKMILVTPRKLALGMKSFKQYKESQGFSVSSYIYEDIATNENELQLFIKKEYNKERFQFAVFFGNEADIPPFRVITTSDTKTPSDYPYFAFGGSHDFIPDVFYSRMVGNHNEDIERQIQKLKEFHERSWVNDHGEKKVIGIASNEGWGPSDVDYVLDMIKPFENEFGFTKDTFFQDNQNSNSVDINVSLNEGAFWLNYIGHGSGTSWSSITTGEYTSRDVWDSRGVGVKPIIIDVACQNGRFNNQDRLGETFMKAHYEGQPIGAVAFYGGSVDISWDPPAIMAIGINRSLQKGAKLGLFEAVMQGQLHLLSTYEDIEAAKENLLWYHLLGDPSLELKTGQW